MMFTNSVATVIFFGTFLNEFANAQTAATTTRYWDCCKPSCGWSSNVDNTGLNFVKTCSASGGTISNNAESVCGGGGDATAGPAYTCTNQQPFTSGGKLYAFAAMNEAGSCCKCYDLTFTSSALTGKTMTVQVTNSGGDLAVGSQFDLMIPGGGFGIYDGCVAPTDGTAGPVNGDPQFTTPYSNWGSRYGGLLGAGLTTCTSLPTELQAGCNWFFSDFQAADNPTVTFTQVTCPVELTSKSGCAGK
eukprot:Pgem_evm1s11705